MDLKAERLNYQASVSIGGQTISMTVAYEVKDENGAWTITEDVTTPQGVIKEMSVIEKGTLMMKNARSIRWDKCEPNLKSKTEKPSAR